MPTASKNIEVVTPQFPHPKKEKFIELYRETRGFISDICRAVMIDRKTYYNWLDADKDFALAIAEAEAEINDEMKDALIRQAGDGNLGAIIFWLKNKHPEFKQNVNVYQQNNITKVEFILDENQTP